MARGHFLDGTAAASGWRFRRWPARRRMWFCASPELQHGALRAERARPWPPLPQEPGCGVLVLVVMFGVCGNTARPAGLSLPGVRAAHEI